jgi:hypothetical protein
MICFTHEVAKADLLSPFVVAMYAHYGVSPYISLSRLCAKPRAGGMSLVATWVTQRRKDSMRRLAQEKTIHR